MRIQLISVLFSLQISTFTVAQADEAKSSFCRKDYQLLNDENPLLAASDLPHQPMNSRRCCTLDVNQLTLNAMLNYHEKTFGNACKNNSTGTPGKLIIVGPSSCKLYNGSIGNIITCVPNQCREGGTTFDQIKRAAEQTTLAATRLAQSAQRAVQQSAQQSIKDQHQKTVAALKRKLEPLEKSRHGRSGPCYDITVQALTKAGLTQSQAKGLLSHGVKPKGWISIPIPFEYKIIKGKKIRVPLPPQVPDGYVVAAKFKGHYAFYLGDQGQGQRNDQYKSQKEGKLSPAPTRYAARKAEFGPAAKFVFEPKAGMAISFGSKVPTEAFAIKIDDLGRYGYL